MNVKMTAGEEDDLHGSSGGWGWRGVGGCERNDHWVSVSTLRERPAALTADSAAVELCVCLPDSSRCVWACLAAGCRRSLCLPTGCCRGKRVCECVCAGGDRARCVDGELGGGEQPGEVERWCWYRRWRAGDGDGGESIALKSEEVGLGQPPPWR